MAVSATVSPGKIFSSDEVITISELNKLGTPTVDISGAVGSLSLSDGSVTNAKIQAAAGIQLDKLASGTSAQVVVANSSGVPTYVALSGDATVDNAGVVTVSSAATVDDDAITPAKLADTTITPGEYTLATVTFDQQGRATAAASGTAVSIETGTLNPSANSTFTVTCGGGGDCLVVLNFQLKADFGSFGTTTCEIRDSGGTTTLASGYGSTSEYDSRYSGNQVTVSYKSTGSSSGATVTLYAYLTGYTGNLEYIKGHYIGT